MDETTKHCPAFTKGTWLAAPRERRAWGMGTGPVPSTCLLACGCIISAGGSCSPWGPPSRGTTPVWLCRRAPAVSWWLALAGPLPQTEARASPSGIPMPPSARGPAWARESLVAGEVLTRLALCHSDGINGDD